MSCPSHRRGLNIGYFSDGDVYKNSSKEFSIEKYKSGDCVGLGINILKGELFFTKNGRMAKSFIEVAKMASVFPMVCCILRSTSFRVNFGQKPFLFNLRSYFSAESNKILRSILNIKLDKAEIAKVIGSYLYLNGCGKTLAYFEEQSVLNREETISRLNQIPVTIKFSKTKSAISSTRSVTEIEGPSLGKTVSVSTASSTSQGTPQPASSGVFKDFRKKLKSFFSGDSSDSPKKDRADTATESSLKKTGSHMSDCLESPGGKVLQVPETLCFTDETAFMERARIKQDMLRNEIEKAEMTFQTFFKDLYDSHSGIRALFKALQFVKLFNEQPSRCVEYAKANITADLKGEKIEFREQGQTTIRIELKEVVGLFAFKDPAQSRLGFLFSQEFRAYSADILNSCILCK